MLLHQCDYDCQHYKDRDHPINGRWVIGEDKYSRCPLTYVDESDAMWLVAYQFYEKGILPNGVGWLKQSNKFIDSISFIKSKVADHGRQELKN